VRYRFGEFDLDTDAFELRHAGSVVEVQPKVFDVIRCLVSNPGRLVTKDELLDTVWADTHVSESAIAFSMSHARRALGQSQGDKEPIETIRGRGFRFVAEVQVAETCPSTPPSSAPQPKAGVSINAGGERSTFVGRETVMGALDAALRSAEAGHGRLVALLGEPGMGKTRAATELAKLAQLRGVSVWPARIHEGEPAPAFWPWIQVIRKCAIDEGLAPEQRAGAEELLVGLSPAEFDDQAGTTSSFRGADTFWLFDRLRTFLVDVASTVRALVILDDLQWADEGSLRLLAQLAPELEHHRTLVIATVRDTEASSPTMRRAMRLAERHHLTGLNADSVAEYLGAISGESVNETLAAAITERTGGNPLFVRETVHYLRSLRPDASLAGFDATAVVIPDAVHDVIRSRVDSLDANVREALQVASVMGDAIDSGAVSHLLQVDRAASLRLIEQMVTARLVVARPNGGYAFAHALVREVFYTNMAASVRATLHGRCAQYLEASGIPTPAHELAYHYHHALPIGFAQQAFRYATQAAEDAGKTHAMADATTCYQWALAAMGYLREADPRRGCELLLQQAEAHQMAGHPRRSREALERAIDLALQQKYGDLLSRAGQRLRPTFLWGAMRDDLALRAFEGALRLLPDGDNAERAIVMSHLSCIPPYSRPLSRAQQLSDDAVAMARRLGDSRSLAEALRARLGTLTGPDTIDALQATADELQKVGQASGFAWVDSEVGNARFYGLLQAGDLEAADRVLAKRDVAVRHARLLEASWNIDRMRVQRQFARGDITGALDGSAKLLAQAERMGLVYGPMYRVFSEALVSWEQQGARAVIGNAELWGPLSSWAPLNPYHGALIARLLAEANVLDEAREHYDALMANDFANVARDLNFLSAMSHLSIVACKLRDLSGARAIYDALAPYAHLHATSFYGTSAGSVSRYLGLLSALLGETKRAREQLETAVAENKRMGLKLELAHTETDLANLAPKRR